MPPVLPPSAPGPLGLVLPPVAPPAVGAGWSTTRSTTEANTTGATTWLGDLCRTAEAAGADALWATDHLFWGMPTLECLTALAVAATATRRATLGTCVLQLPLRAPAAVAKQASTLQILSGGRFVLGVGVGSHEEEYRLAAADYGRRGAELDRGVAALRQAWASAEDPATRYRQEPSAPVPVWIGGSSPAARRRAAASGDGWIPLFVPPDEFAEHLALLREDTNRGGRHASSVVAAVVMVASVGDDASVAATTGAAWLSRLYGIPPKAFRRHLVAGPAERCAEVASQYLAAGAQHVAVMLAGDEPVAQFAALAAALAITTDTPNGRAHTPPGASGGTPPGTRTPILAGVAR